MRKRFSTPEEAQEAADMQDNLPVIIKLIHKRLDLLERVFGRIMQLDMRLDTLEFNSGVPVKPAISERLLALELKLNELTNKEEVDE